MVLEGCMRKAFGLMSSQGDVSFRCSNNHISKLNLLCYRHLSTFHGEYERKRGSAILAFNEWISYYNIILNPLDLKAGHEYIIKVKPEKHIANHQIKDYDVQSRKCLFPEENEVLYLYYLSSISYL